jgi:dipeptide transport system ATP-binding protein
MVMYFGEAVEYGTREAVFSDPKHDYTKTLFAATPKADPDSIRARLARKKAA